MQTIEAIILEYPNGHVHVFTLGLGPCGREVIGLSCEVSEGVVNIQQLCKDAPQYPTYFGYPLGTLKRYRVYTAKEYPTPEKLAYYRSLAVSNDEQLQEKEWAKQEAAARRYTQEAYAYLKASHSAHVVALQKWDYKWTGLYEALSAIPEQLSEPYWGSRRPWPEEPPKEPAKDPISLGALLRSKLPNW